MDVLDRIFRWLGFGGPEVIPELGRNDRCWCGSGKKYKHCHKPEDDRKRAAGRAVCKGPT